MYISIHSYACTHIAQVRPTHCDICTCHKHICMHIISQAAALLGSTHAMLNIYVIRHHLNVYLFLRLQRFWDPLMQHICMHTYFSGCSASGIHSCNTYACTLTSQAAALLGSTHAMLNLGGAYLHGDGTSKNMTMSLHWLKVSECINIQQGHIYVYIYMLCTCIKLMY